MTDDEAVSQDISNYLYQLYGMNDTIRKVIIKHKKTVCTNVWKLGIKLLKSPSLVSKVILGSPPETFNTLTFNKVLVYSDPSSWGSPTAAHYFVISMLHVLVEFELRPYVWLVSRPYEV